MTERTTAEARSGVTTARYGSSAVPAAQTTDGTSTGDTTLGAQLAHQLVLVLANVTVLTALLVYFGWRRSETQNHRLGFDESILGMSTQDYILRSVGPVIELLAVVTVLGLAGWWLDRALARSIEDASSGERGSPLRRARRARLWAWAATALAVAIPSIAFVALSTFPYSATAFVAWPLALGSAVLLVLYAGRLRGLSQRAAPIGGAAKALAVITACIALFWAASNRAEVLGNQFADDFAHNVEGSIRVVAYSTERLHIGAPGVIEQQLPGDNSRYHYRYTGLRFLEHTNGQYFLVSDGWTPTYGVIVIVSNDDDVRLEFVHDDR